MNVHGFLDFFRQGFNFEFGLGEFTRKIMDLSLKICNSAVLVFVIFDLVHQGSDFLLFWLYFYYS